MPELETIIEEGLLLRELCYGGVKLKKTWWAGNAAAAGFNVIMIDGDDGLHILNNIEPAIRKRISVIDAIDEFDRPVMAELVTRVLKGRPFLWNEKTKRLAPSVAAANPLHQHMYFDATKLTANDVLVMDSWTALSWSLSFRFAVEHSIDLSDASKTEWDGYMWSGNMANWVLSQISALPCHVVIIAHEQLAEKYENNKVVSSRTQPASISKNHSKLLGGKFSEILYFKIVGRTINIDTNASSSRDGGSRLIPPGIYKWEDLQFKDVCRYAGIVPPIDAPLSEAIKFFKSGEVIPEDTLPVSKGKTPLKASAAKVGTSPKVGAVTKPGSLTFVKK